MYTYHHETHKNEQGEEEKTSAAAAMNTSRES